MSLNNNTQNSGSPDKNTELSTQNQVPTNIEAPKATKPALNKKFCSAEKLLAKPITIMPCLIDPILSQTGIFCLTGGSDSGKSSLFRQLGYHIVAGESHFLDWKINAKHRRVYYVSTEDDLMAINVQLNKLHKKFGRPPLDLKELHFLVYTEELINTLKEALTHYPADLVIIDVLMDLYSGSINETNKIRNFMQGFQELAMKHKCLIGFVHHNGKRTQMFAPHKDNMLGSQGIESKARLVLELRNDPKVPGIKHLCILKGNYLPVALKNESYELKFEENHLSFELTGRRVSFEELVAIPKKSDEDDYQNYEKACRLRDQGLSYEKIAETLGYKSKSSVFKLFKKYDKGKIPHGSSSEGN